MNQNQRLFKSLKTDRLFLVFLRKRNFNLVPHENRKQKNKLDD